MWKDCSGTITEEFIVTPTTCKNITVQNCSGKYASEVQPSGGDGIRFKGIHGGSGGLGSGTGWEDAYIGSYGNNFHDGFQSDTKGSIACLFITPSATNNETIVLSGNPLFYKDGDLDMISGDSIEFTMGYYAKGHTSFTGETTFVIGTANWGVDEFGNNIDKEFQWQLDGGSWNGTWLDMKTASNFTSISGNIEGGIRFKIRLTCTSGSYSSMSMVVITSTTTLQAQRDNFYPIDQDTVNINVNVLAEGVALSDARVYLIADAGGALPEGTVILSDLSNVTGDVSTDLVYSGDQPVKGHVRKSTSAPYYKSSPLVGTITTAGYSSTAVMILDQ